MCSPHSGSLLMLSTSAGSLERAHFNPKITTNDFYKAGFFNNRKQIDFIPGSIKPLQLKSTIERLHTPHRTPRTPSAQSEPGNLGILQCASSQA